MSNYCPNCGHRMFQHGRKGCQHVETVGHIVRVTSAGWTLKHPVSERENDKLFDCIVNVRLSAIMARGGPVLGEYAIVEKDDGSWSFKSPPEQARQQCDCNWDTGVRRANTGLLLEIVKRGVGPQVWGVAHELAERGFAGQVGFILDNQPKDVGNHDISL